MNQNKCLLIVEDDQELRELLIEICSDITPDIRSAANGAEALYFLAEGNIDAVLSDISMPKLSGLELLEKLRCDGNEIPFVILSGHDSRKNISEAIRLGVTEFLDKPFNNEKLLSVIKAALEYGVALREAEKELEQVYKFAKLPPHRLLNLKSARKTLWTTRDQSPLIKKKAEAAS